MTGQLGGHPRPVDLGFGGVVKDMEPSGTAEEFPHRCIVIRYRNPISRNETITSGWRTPPRSNILGHPPSRLRPSGVVFPLLSGIRTVSQPMLPVGVAAGGAGLLGQRVLESLGGG
jgi:hypothetical protein